MNLVHEREMYDELDIDFNRPARREPKLEDLLAGNEI